jgi:hypothetical protein
MRRSKIGQYIKAPFSKQLYKIVNISDMLIEIRSPK